MLYETYLLELAIQTVSEIFIVSDDAILQNLYYKHYLRKSKYVG